MNFNLFIVALFLFIGAILSIASTAIGMQCYTSPVSTIKTDKPNNYNYMIFNIVSASLLLIVAGIAMFFSISSKRLKVHVPGRE